MGDHFRRLNHLDSRVWRPPFLLLVLVLLPVLIVRLLVVIGGL